MRKNAKELNVNWCEEFKLSAFVPNEEILVNFTEKRKQVMILDLGAPVSLAGNEWMNQYLEDHGLDGKEDVLQVFTYLVDAYVPFLCGKRELKDRWKSKIDTENNVLETKIDGKRKDFRMVGTGGNHVALEIEKRDLKEEQILFTNESEVMNTFKAIRKVHEVTNHKSAEQLLKHYRRANLIGPNTVKLIKQVVRDCKICQKFGRSMVKPKIALPNASSFNEVVTLDLKQFGDKYVLWCIDSFTRFIQGKLLRNKKAETILNAINECWNLSFGIPAVGFYPC